MLFIIICWFLFFFALALRNEYEPGSKNYKDINIFVWILGFISPGFTAFFILVAIYSCIFDKSNKKIPLLDPLEDIPTAVRIDSV